MTGAQARKLKKGDRVRWIAEKNSRGVITEISRFGVEIKWSDGLTTRPFFNDMASIEQIDRDGNLFSR
jgi:hypothetical protein